MGASVSVLPPWRFASLCSCRPPLSTHTTARRQPTATIAANTHSNPNPNSTQQMAEPAAAFYFLQLVRAVLHVHAAGFCHRDIKVRRWEVHNCCLWCCACVSGQKGEGKTGFCPPRHQGVCGGKFTLLLLLQLPLLMLLRAGWGVAWGEGDATYKQCAAHRMQRSSAAWTSIKRASEGERAVLLRQESARNGAPPPRAAASPSIPQTNAFGHGQRSWCRAKGAGR